MAIRGRKRRLALEDEYWCLIGAGVGTVEACRTLGIGRKTGYRWRAERGGVPPARVAEHARGGRYLSLVERERIAVLDRAGVGVREIARRLDRSPSTVSRELRRNRAPHDGAYDPGLAHVRARERARRDRNSVLVRDVALRDLVQAKLELQWSPEQIAGWLRSTYPDRTDWHVCAETIYQALYRGGISGLPRVLTRNLRFGRALRRPRRRPDRRQGRPRFRAPSKLVDQRPAAASDRIRIGDWESQCCLSSGGGQWFLVEGAVTDHGPDRVEPASGERDDRLLVGLALGAFPVVERT